MNNGEGIYVGTDPLQAGGVPDRTAYISITNNLIYNTPAEAVDLKSASSNCIVENNVIHDTREGHNGAIHVGHWDNPLIVPNHVIASNRIYNVTGNGGYGILVKSGGVKIFNNIIYNTSQYGIVISDNKATRLIGQVYNNTLYKNSRGGLQVFDNALFEIKNNLSWANGSGNIDYDPLFVDASRGDFRLCDGPGSPVPTCLARSPAVAAGINVGLPFSGLAPNLGATDSSVARPTTYLPNPKLLTINAD
jgi:hypothetical protein